MARRPAFKIIKTSEGWRINVPASLSESGKRERHFHKTRDKAATHAAQLRERYQKHGESATIIRPGLAESAVAAEKLLRPWGVTLLEAAKIVAQMRKDEEASKRLEEAAHQWLLSCEGLRARTIGGYRQTVERLKDALGDRLLANIKVADLQNVLAPPGVSGASARGRIRNARAFWRWAAKKGWCDSEVCSAIEVPKSGYRQGEIVILTTAEVQRLLRVAEEYFPEAVASYAIQVFAGVRAEELRRLEAHHVTSDGITLSREVTKKGRRRHINPNPTLAAWLEIYPFKPCPNWKEVDKACRRLAGWRLKARLLEKSKKFTKLPKSDLGPWPQNALRHSHASYAVAYGVSLDTLLFEFGHAGSPAMLREHYVGRASKMDAIKFFSLGPKGEGIPSIAAA